MNGLESTIDFTRSVLVVAHPDDEALWFTSILAHVPETISCYRDVLSRPVCSAGRNAALSSGLLGRQTSLGLVEAEVSNTAGWPHPIVTEYGFHLRSYPDTMAGFSPSRYRKNYFEIVRTLRPRLLGVGTVFTHNPWGEYGHEEHAQVFRAVDMLRKELGFKLYVTNYVSNKSLALFHHYVEYVRGERLDLITQPSLGVNLRCVYENNACWTWFDGYVWPERESFFCWTGLPLRSHNGWFLPLNFIDIHFGRRAETLMPRWLIKIQEAIRRRFAWA